MSEIETPPHPGTILRLFLTRNSIAQETLSAAMCISRPSVNQVIMQKKGMSTDFIIRLAFVTGTPEEYWSGVQTHWKLWYHRQHLAGAFGRMTRLYKKGDHLL